MNLPRSLDTAPDHDLDLIASMLYFLREGWSIEMARKKSNISPTVYKELKDTYPEIKQIFKPFYKRIIGI